MSHRAPQHLKKYCVDQNYGRYTPEDQAVWRFIMRQLKDYLSKHAHPSYEEGLERTGIQVDRIPKISDMDAALSEFGWGAVPVSGFIPPAAFMEFQSLRLLPIASDMRTLDHILYTPAPDIVHEAAGHAPILINKEFSEYLSEYAEVASNAILSKEDLDLYKAIRELSDIKENPDSTDKEVEAAEQGLARASSAMRYVSEAGFLGRMNWWTAEYGLIGAIGSPKIYGAGLLSSVGEAKDCLSDGVKKIPFSIGCLDFNYDITEPQPQLFVVKGFDDLKKVLRELADTMAFKTGGQSGLKKAIEAQTVNTVELDSGLQVSGELTTQWSEDGQPYFIKFEGPCQLAFGRQQLENHGTDYHAHGYSTPIGLPLNFTSPPKVGDTLDWTFKGGIHLTGLLKSTLQKDGLTLIHSIEQCKIVRGDEVLFDPSWGMYDMAWSQKVVSVFGGPADRLSFGDNDDFIAARVPKKSHSSSDLGRHQFFQKVRDYREQNKKDGQELNGLIMEFFKTHSEDWLMGIELLELSLWIQADEAVKSDLLNHLEHLKTKHPRHQARIDDGIRLAPEII